MDNSSFSDSQRVFPDAERLPVEGATCEGYRVKLYGKLHFLKRLKPKFSTNPRYVAAIQKEFETGYNLDHPHLVRYLACGDDYLLMEWVDGLTLDEFAKQNPDFFKNEADVRRLLGELLDVLQYLHSHQIVHLDLKPENIIITRIGNELKLTDLGFCYTDTYTDTMGRTDSFAAPEQLNGDGSVDQRTDIFAVGRIISSLPCAKRYRSVIERCTKHDKEERYPSAAALKKALNKRHGKWLIFTVIVAIACLIALSIVWGLSSKQSTEAPNTNLPGDTLEQATATTPPATTDSASAMIDDSNDTSSPTIISDKEPNVTANEPNRTVTKQVTIDPETLRNELLEATLPIYDKYLKRYENVSTIDPFEKTFSEAYDKCLRETANTLFRLYETKYKPMGILESDYNPIASKVILYYKGKVEKKFTY